MRLRHFLWIVFLGTLALMNAVKAQDGITPMPSMTAHEVLRIKGSSVFWSPDSHYLVVSHPTDSVSGGAQSDFSYSVIDVISGKSLFDVARFVDWLPDSKHIITRDDDTADAQIRDVPDGNIIMTLEGAQIGWKWNTDHSQAASESADHSLHIYDLASGESLQAWRNVLVQDALWNEDGRLIAVLGVDTILRVYDVMTGSLKAQVTGYQPIGWSADDRQLIVTPKQRTFQNQLAIWTLESGTTVTFDVLNMSYLWSPDGKRLAIAGTDESVHLVDTDTGTTLQKIEGFQSNIQLFRWDEPDQLIVVTGDYGAGIKPAFEVFNLQTDLRTLKAEFDITAASRIMDDHLEIIQLCTNICRLEYDLKTGKQLSQTDFHAPDVLSSILVSPDFQWVLNTMYPGDSRVHGQYLFLYNLQAAAVQTLPGEDFVLYSTWSPDSHFFAVIDANMVHVWAV